MLKHKLDAKHTQIKCLSFPHRYAYQRAYYKRGERVILGIGGNIGAVLRRFEKLIIYFKRSPFVSIIKSIIKMRPEQTETTVSHPLPDRLSVSQYLASWVPLGISICLRHRPTTAVRSMQTYR